MSERELDAIIRLTSWQRDYGDKCTSETATNGKETDQWQGSERNRA